MVYSHFFVCPTLTFKTAQLRLYVGLISKKSAQTNQQVAQTAYETFQKCFFFLDCSDV